MSSTDNAPRKFRIEGSGRMLEALVQAIESALQAARSTPYRTGEGCAAHGVFEIEVEANSGPDNLKYAISRKDDACSTIEGWAEIKRCCECDTLVAFIFDDAYLETVDGDGVICCECWRLEEDSEQQT
jgi:hypothetical protein